jgi:hypothetical protein
MAPEAISTAYFINPLSVRVSVYRFILVFKTREVGQKKMMDDAHNSKCLIIDFLDIIYRPLLYLGARGSRVG